jgi:hypothetical protein
MTRVRDHLRGEFSASYRKPDFSGQKLVPKGLVFEWKAGNKPQSTVTAHGRRFCTPPQQGTFRESTR